MMEKILMILAIILVSALIILVAVCYSIFESVVIWNNKFVTPAIILAVLIHMGMTVWEHGKSDYTKVLSNGFVTLYVTMSMSCLALTRAEYGTWMLMLIFVCAWLTDTGAYFTGISMFFMCISLSSNIMIFSS